MLKNIFWFVSGSAFTCVFTVTLTKWITKRDPKYLDEACRWYKS